MVVWRVCGGGWETVGMKVLQGTSRITQKKRQPNPGPNSHTFSEKLFVAEALFVKLGVGKEDFWMLPHSRDGCRVTIIVQGERLKEYNVERRRERLWWTRQRTDKKRKGKH